MKFIQIIFCLSLCIFGLNAETLSQIELEYKSKLETSLSELALLRKSLAEQQIPLAKETEKLKSELKEVRKELNTLKAVEDSKTIELDTLKNNIQQSEKEISFITNTLIDEAIIHLESTMSIGKLNSKANPIRDFQQKRDQLESSSIEYLELQLQALDRSMAFTDSLFTVQKFDGQAQSREGKLQEGQYLQLGPILYFITSNNDLAGLVVESKSLKPEIYTIKPEPTQLLIDYKEGKTSSLPIDPSLNRAIMIASTEDTIQEHLKKGGIWVYPIIFFAGLSTLIAIIKCIQLFSIRIPNTKHIASFAQAIKSKDFDQAQQLAQKQPQPARKMLLNAVEYGNEQVELIEESMMEAILQVQPKLERFLNILAVTAATAPLLGLLGTVTGIIKTFKLMEVFGAGDPKPLISGISEALITTELGLILAIPALILFALLSRRVSRTIAKLEECSFHLVNLISKTQDQPEAKPN